MSNTLSYLSSSPSVTNHVLQQSRAKDLDKLKGSESKTVDKVEPKGHLGDFLKVSESSLVSASTASKTSQEQFLASVLKGDKAVPVLLNVEQKEISSVNAILLKPFSLEDAQKYMGKEAVQPTKNQLLYFDPADNRLIVLNVDGTAKAYSLADKPSLSKDLRTTTIHTLYLTKSAQTSGQWVAAYNLDALKAVLLREKSGFGSGIQEAVIGGESIFVVSDSTQVKDNFEKAGDLNPLKRYIRSSDMVVTEVEFNAIKKEQAELLKQEQEKSKTEKTETELAELLNKKVEAAVNTLRRDKAFGVAFMLDKQEQEKGFYLNIQNLQVKNVVNKDKKVTGVSVTVGGDTFVFESIEKLAEKLGKADGNNVWVLELEGKKLIYAHNSKQEFVKYASLDAYRAEVASFMHELQKPYSGYYGAPYVWGEFENGKARFVSYGRTDGLFNSLQVFEKSEDFTSKFASSLRFANITLKKNQTLQEAAFEVCKNKPLGVVRLAVNGDTYFAQLSEDKTKVLLGVSEADLMASQARAERLVQAKAKSTDEGFVLEGCFVGKHGEIITLLTAKNGRAIDEELLKLPRQIVSYKLKNGNTVYKVKDAYGSVLTFSDKSYAKARSACLDFVAKNKTKQDEWTLVQVKNDGTKTPLFITSSAADNGENSKAVEFRSELDRTLKVKDVKVKEKALEEFSEDAFETLKNGQLIKAKIAGEDVFVIREAGNLIFNGKLVQFSSLDEALKSLGENLERGQAIKRLDGKQVVIVQKDHDGKVHTFDSDKAYLEALDKQEYARILLSAQDANILTEKEETEFRETLATMKKAFDSHQGKFSTNQARQLRADIVKAIETALKDDQLINRDVAFKFKELIEALPEVTETSKKLTGTENIKLLEGIAECLDADILFSKEDRNLEWSDTTKAVVSGALAFLQLSDAAIKGYNYYLDAQYDLNHHKHGSWHESKAQYSDRMWKEMGENAASRFEAVQNGASEALVALADGIWNVYTQAPSVQQVATTTGKALAYSAFATLATRSVLSASRSDSSVGVNAIHTALGLVGLTTLPTLVQAQPLSNSTTAYLDSLLSSLAQNGTCALAHNDTYFSDCTGSASASTDSLSSAIGYYSDQQGLTTFQGATSDAGLGTGYSPQQVFDYLNTHANSTADAYKAFLTFMVSKLGSSGGQYAPDFAVLCDPNVICDTVVIDHTAAPVTPPTLQQVVAAEVAKSMLTVQINFNTQVNGFRNQINAQDATIIQLDRQGKVKEAFERAVDQRNTTQMQDIIDAYRLSFNSDSMFLDSLLTRNTTAYQTFFKDECALARNITDLSTLINKKADYGISGEFPQQIQKVIEVRKTDFAVLAVNSVRSLDELNSLVDQTFASNEWFLVPTVSSSNSSSNSSSTVFNSTQVLIPAVVQAQIDAKRILWGDVSTAKTTASQVQGDLTQVKTDQKALSDQKAAVDTFKGLLASNMTTATTYFTNSINANYSSAFKEAAATYFNDKLQVATNITTVSTLLTQASSFNLGSSVLAEQTAKVKQSLASEKIASAKNTTELTNAQTEFSTVAWFGSSIPKSIQDLIDAQRTLLGDVSTAKTTASQVQTELTQVKLTADSAKTTSDALNTASQNEKVLLDKVTSFKAQLLSDVKGASTTLDLAQNATDGSFSAFQSEAFNFFKDQIAGANDTTSLAAVQVHYNNFNLTDSQVSILKAQYDSKLAVFNGYTVDLTDIRNQLASFSGNQNTTALQVKLAAATTFAGFLEIEADAISKNQTKALTTQQWASYREQILNKNLQVCVAEGNFGALPINQLTPNELNTTAVFISRALGSKLETDVIKAFNEGFQTATPRLIVDTLIELGRLFGCENSTLVPYFSINGENICVDQTLIRTLDTLGRGIFDSLKSKIESETQGGTNTDFIQGLVKGLFNGTLPKATLSEKLPSELPAVDPFAPQALVGQVESHESDASELGNRTAQALRGSSIQTTIRTSESPSTEVSVGSWAAIGLGFVALVGLLGLSVESCTAKKGQKTVLGKVLDWLRRSVLCCKCCQLPPEKSTDSLSNDPVQVVVQSLQNAVVKKAVQEVAKEVAFNSSSDSKHSSEDLLKLTEDSTAIASSMKSFDELRTKEKVMAANKLFVAKLKPSTKRDSDERISVVYKYVADKLAADTKIPSGWIQLLLADDRLDGSLFETKAGKVMDAIINILSSFGEKGTELLTVDVALRFLNKPEISNDIPLVYGKSGDKLCLLPPIPQIQEGLVPHLEVKSVDPLDPMMVKALTRITAETKDNEVVLQLREAMVKQIDTYMHNDLDALKVSIRSTAPLLESKLPSNDDFDVTTLLAQYKSIYDAVKTALVSKGDSEKNPFASDDDDLASEFSVSENDAVFKKFNTDLATAINSSESSPLLKAFTSNNPVAEILKFYQKELSELAEVTASEALVGQRVESSSTLGRELQSSHLALKISLVPSSASSSV